jgi:hypothetical protein
LASQYLRLGRNLERLPTWKSFISQNVTDWIWISSGKKHEAEMVNILLRLCSVWGVDEAEAEGLSDRTLAITLAALANVWTSFQFSNPQDVKRFVELENCTVSKVFVPQDADLSNIRIRLARSLNEAASSAKNGTCASRLSEESHKALEKAAKALTEMGTEIFQKQLLPVGRSDDAPAQEHWRELYDGFWLKFSELTEPFQKISKEMRT